MTTTPRTLLAVSLIMLFSLVAVACTETSPLSLTIEPDVSVAALDDLSRLRTRVYSVAEVDETFATATSDAGSPISGVSCEVIARLAPDAVDCSESERTVLRDRDLIHQGPVPVSGQLTIDRGAQAVRVYVELPASELRIDENGRICNWTTAQVIQPGETDVLVAVQPRC